MNKEAIFVIAKEHCMVKSSDGIQDLFNDVIKDGHFKRCKSFLDDILRCILPKTLDHIFDRLIFFHWTVSKQTL